MTVIGISEKRTMKFGKFASIFFMVSFCTGVAPILIFIYPLMYVSSGSISFFQYYSILNDAGVIFSTAVTFIIFYYLTRIVGRIEKIKATFLLIFLGIFSGGVMSLVLINFTKSGLLISLSVALFTEFSSVVMWLPAFISGTGGVFAGRMKSLKGGTSG